MADLAQVWIKTGIKLVSPRIMRSRYSTRSRTEQGNGLKVYILMVMVLIAADSSNLLDDPHTAHVRESHVLPILMDALVLSYV